MTAPRDLDRLVRAFLSEGPTELPDPSFDAVRDRTESTRQRVVIGPWRFPDMNRFVPIGAGVAAVAVALVVGTQLLGGTAPGGAGGAPSAEPTATASPSPAPSPSPVAGLPEGSFVVSEASAGGPPVTVSIPAPGWTHDRQFDALVKGTEVANLPEATILFWRFPSGTSFSVPGDPCRTTSSRPEAPVTTVEDFAAALAAQASRDASEPVDVTVGGYGGKSLTLHVPDDVVIDACEEGAFVSYGAGEDSLARYQQGPGQVDELWIVDVDGAIVVIDAMYRPDSAPALIEEMRAIAKSTTFE